MYRCDDCGHLFEEPNRSDMEEDTGYVRVSCPECGSEDYREVHLCKACKQEYTEDEFCEECMEKLNGDLYASRLGLGVDEEVYQDMIAERYGW